MNFRAKKSQDLKNIFLLLDPVKRNLGQYAIEQRDVHVGAGGPRTPRTPPTFPDSLGKLTPSFRRNHSILVCGRVEG